MDVKSENPKFKSADARDYSKLVVYMTMEELYSRSNLLQSLKDAETIVWITRKKE